MIFNHYSCSVIIIRYNDSDNKCLLHNVIKIIVVINIIIIIINWSIIILIDILLYYELCIMHIHFDSIPGPLLVLFIPMPYMCINHFSFDFVHIIASLRWWRLYNSSVSVCGPGWRLPPWSGSLWLAEVLRLEALPAPPDTRRPVTSLRSLSGRGQAWTPNVAFHGEGGIPRGLLIIEESNSPREFTIWFWNAIKNLKRIPNIIVENNSQWNWSMQLPKWFL